MKIRLMSNQQTIRKNQKGIVAILLTMVMMILVTMIVLAFSLVIRRNQRQTVDRQLNSRAYYAAESAINSVNAALDAGVVATSLTKSTCAMNTVSDLPLPLRASPYAESIPISSAANGLGVTCLTIDPLSYNLAYSSIGVDTTQNAHIKANAPVPGGIQHIQVAWQGATGAAASGSSFPPFGALPGTSPVLRIDLIPAGSLDLTTMYNRARVFFLYPDTSGGTGNTDSVLADTRGQIVNAKCHANNTPKACLGSITVLDGATEYYIRIRPIYYNADVIVTAQDAARTAIQLTDGQITIDATGRSAQILKRISVRRPVTIGSTTPAFAIDSNASICKLLATLPGETVDNTCAIP
jgi:Tfp pilus assembly protein PilX